MGQRKRLDSFPDVKAELDRMLEENTCSQEQIAKFLTEYADSMGYDVTVTRRIVSRELDAKKKEKQALKQHQEVTKEIVRQYGDISLADMGKGISALVSGLAVNTIKKLDKDTLEVKDIKDLVAISKSVSETAAINFDLEIKQEAHDKAKRGEKIIPHEELDVIYEEQLQQQAELQAKIANRKKRDTDSDYLDSDLEQDE